MCGIAGLIGHVSNGYEIVRSMLDEIIHRGPDFTDIRTFDQAILGHNRLSIIDIDKRSNQPFTINEFSIIYNGEIYNFHEIREELINLGYRFRTESDTEVVLNSFIQWGESCVDKFVGMWAFVIWDDERHEAFCSRDRFGIKPFYYMQKNGVFYFGSEVKALRKIPDFSSRINKNQSNLFQHLGWLYYKDRTLYEEVFILEPSHNIKIDRNGQLHKRRYWDVNFDKIQISEREAKEQFNYLFRQSITQHMRSDVEVGGCLSGGLDSSLIASTVGVLFPEKNYKVFTIYYEGNQEHHVDERFFAQSVINKYSNLDWYTKMPSKSDVKQEFDKYSYYQDFPVGGSSPISQYFVMKLAAEHGIKVLLDGQGADEYLAGYMHSYFRIVGQNIFNPNNWLLFLHHLKLNKYSISESVSRFLKTIYTSFNKEGQINRMEYFMSSKTLFESSGIDLPNKGITKLDSFLYNIMFHSILPNLLHFEDRNSMAFSIESRVPFLDHRLVEFCFSLPDNFKIRGDVTKYILRKAMKDILPNEVYQRKDKKGFVTPGEKDWYDLLFTIPNGRVYSGSYKKRWRKAAMDHWIKNNSVLL